MYTQQGLYNTRIRIHSKACLINPSAKRAARWAPFNHLRLETKYFASNTEKRSKGRFSEEFLCWSNYVIFWRIFKPTFDKKHNYALELQHEASLAHTRDQKTASKKRTWVWLLWGFLAHCSHLQGSRDSPPRPPVAVVDTVETDDTWWWGGCCE